MALPARTRREPRLLPWRLRLLLLAVMGGLVAFSAAATLRDGEAKADGGVPADAAAIATSNSTSGGHGDGGGDTGRRELDATADAIATDVNEKLRANIDWAELLATTTIGMDDKLLGPSPLDAQNITGLFKGNWTPALDSHLEELQFTHNTGRLAIQLYSEPLTTVSSDIAYLSGHLRLRDGTFITDPSLHFYVHGFHLRRLGSALLVANRLEGLRFMHELPAMVSSPALALELEEAIVETRVRERERRKKVGNRSVFYAPRGGGRWEPNGRSRLDADAADAGGGADGDDARRPHPTSAAAAAAANDGGGGADGDDARAATQKRKALLAELNHEETAESRERQREHEGIFIDGGSGAPHCSFLLNVAQVDGTVDGDGEPAVLRGVAVSPNCPQSAVSFSLSALEMTAFNFRALRYLLVAWLIFVSQILLTLRQFRYTSTDSSVGKVSLVMLAMQAVIDAFWCVFHITGGIVFERLFNAFAIIAFAKFVLVSGFEMRYLTVIWRVRRLEALPQGRQHTPAEWLEMRRDLSMLYSRFYAVLFLFGMVLVLRMEKVLRVATFGLFSFWVPQIVCNATRNQRKALDPRYVMGMSVTRLLLPAYFMLCPQNTEFEPSPGFLRFLALWVFVQVTVLQLQDQLGPRFFVPAYYLPQAYNYHRAIDFNTLYDVNRGEFDDSDCDGDGGGDGGNTFRSRDPTINCVICMYDIDRHPFSYMVTPCNHLFHASCLERWMDVKMDCPTCRAPLPPL